MKKYLAYAKTNANNTFVYRGAITIWILGNIFSVLALTALWLNAPASGVYGGYTQPELITYYIVGLFVQWLTNWMPFYWIKDEIADGSITGSVLIRPVSFFWRTFFTELGWHGVTMFVGLAAMLIFAFLFSSHIILPNSLFTILVTSLATALAIFLVFTFSMCMGMLAFWFTNVYTVDSIFWIGRLIFGGQGIPISFLPTFVNQLAVLMPYRYMYSFPLETYFSKLNNNELIQGFLMQIIWITVMLTVYKFMWDHGRKNYSAQGN